MMRSSSLAAVFLIGTLLLLLLSEARVIMGAVVKWTCPSNGELRKVGAVETNPIEITTEKNCKIVISNHGVSSITFMNDIVDVVINIDGVTCRDTAKLFSFGTKDTGCIVFRNRVMSSAKISITNTHWREIVSTSSQYIDLRLIVHRKSIHNVQTYEVINCEMNVAAQAQNNHVYLHLWQIARYSVLENVERMHFQNLTLDSVYTMVTKDNNRFTPVLHVVQTALVPIRNVKEIIFKNIGMNVWGYYSQRGTQARVVELRGEVYGGVALQNVSSVFVEDVWLRVQPATFLAGTDGGKSQNQLSGAYAINIFEMVDVQNLTMRHLRVGLLNVVGSKSVNAGLVQLQNCTRCRHIALLGGASTTNDHKGRTTVPPSVLNGNITLFGTTANKLVQLFGLRFRGLADTETFIVENVRMNILSWMPSAAGPNNARDLVIHAIYYKPNFYGNPEDPFLRVYDVRFEDIVLNVTATRAWSMSDMEHSNISISSFDDIRSMRNIVTMKWIRCKINAGIAANAPDPVDPMSPPKPWYADVLIARFSLGSAVNPFLFVVMENVGAFSFEHCAVRLFDPELAAYNLVGPSKTETSLDKFHALRLVAAIMIIAKGGTGTVTIGRTSELPPSYSASATTINEGIHFKKCFVRVIADDGASLVSSSSTTTHYSSLMTATLHEVSTGIFSSVASISVPEGALTATDCKVQTSTVRPVASVCKIASVLLHFAVAGTIRHVGLTRSAVEVLSRAPMTGGVSPPSSNMIANTVYGAGIQFAKLESDNADVSNMTFFKARVDVDVDHVEKVTSYMFYSYTVVPVSSAGAGRTPARTQFLDIAVVDSHAHLWTEKTPPASGSGSSSTSLRDAKLIYSFLSMIDNIVVSDSSVNATNINSAELVNSVLAKTVVVQRSSVFARNLFGASLFHMNLRMLLVDSNLKDKVPTPLPLQSLLLQENNLIARNIQFFGGVMALSYGPVNTATVTTAKDIAIEGNITFARNNISVHARHDSASASTTTPTLAIPVLLVSFRLAQIKIVNERYMLSPRADGVVDSDQRFAYCGNAGHITQLIVPAGSCSTINDTIQLTTATLRQTVNSGPPNKAVSDAYGASEVPVGEFVGDDATICAVSRSRSDSFSLPTPTQTKGTESLSYPEKGQSPTMTAAESPSKSVTFDITPLTKSHSATDTIEVVPDLVNEQYAAASMAAAGTSVAAAFVGAPGESMMVSRALVGISLLGGCPDGRRKKDGKSAHLFEPLPFPIAVFPGLRLGPAGEEGAYVKGALFSHLLVVVIIALVAYGLGYRSVSRVQDHYAKHVFGSGIGSDGGAGGVGGMKTISSSRVDSTDQELLLGIRNSSNGSKTQKKHKKQQRITVIDAPRDKKPNFVEKASPRQLRELRHDVENLSAIDGSPIAGFLLRYLSMSAPFWGTCVGIATASSITHIQVAGIASIIAVLAFVIGCGMVIAWVSADAERRPLCVRSTPYWRASPSGGVQRWVRDLLCSVRGRFIFVAKYAWQNPNKVRKNLDVPLPPTGPLVNLGTFLGRLRGPRLRSTGCDVDRSFRYRLSPYFLLACLVVTCLCCTLKGAATEDPQLCNTARGVLFAVNVVSFALLVILRPYLLPVHQLVAMLLDLYSVIVSLIALPGVLTDPSQVDLAKQVLGYITTTLVVMPVAHRSAQLALFRLSGEVQIVSVDAHRRHVSMLLDQLMSPVVVAAARRQRTTGAQHNSDEYDLDAAGASGGGGGVRSAASFELTVPFGMGNHQDRVHQFGDRYREDDEYAQEELLPMGQSKNAIEPPASASSSPRYSPPATPRYSPPATPRYSPPATPRYSPPATPRYSPPATPRAKKNRKSR